MANLGGSDKLGSSVKADEKSESRFWSWLRRTFLTGLLVIAPVAITAWILNALLGGLDASLGRLLARAFGIQIPLLGLFSLVLLILLTGVVARNIFGRELLRLANRILARIPLVNKIYNASQQIIDVILGKQQRLFRQVVLVEYPRKGVYVMGFVTSTSRGEVQDRTGGTVVNVFVPTTPNPTSGFLLFVPEAELTPLEMSVEDGIKLVISGGAVVPAVPDAVPERIEG